jgi:hypothetical protein
MAPFRATQPVRPWIAYPGAKWPILGHIGLTWLCSDYSPCWDKLEFHNGKLAKTDSPLSGCRPPNASRSKGATEIKKKAKVEIENKRVREEVEEAEKGNGTPKKAVSAQDGAFWALWGLMGLWGS